MNRFVGDFIGVGGQRQPNDRHLLLILFLFIIIIISFIPVLVRVDDFDTFSATRNRTAHSASKLIQVVALTPDYDGIIEL